MGLPEIDTRGRVLGYLVSLGLIVSAGLNVWLAYQLRSARAEARVTPSPPSALLGKTLPTLAGRQVNDPRSSKATEAQEVTKHLSFEGNRCNVLYVFAEQCQWCQRNLPRAKEMQRKLRALGARVVAVSFDSDQTQLKRYVQSAMPSFEVFANLNDDARRAMRVPGTPWTAAVDTKGEVLAEWAGAYDDQAIESILATCKKQIAES